MFAGPRVFDDDFDKVELLYREGEMQDLFQQLTGATSSDGILITGSSGVGKSLFASKALDRYQTRFGADRVHIKALGKTTAGILRAVLEGLPNGPAGVAQTTPTEKVRRELREAIERKTVVVLDEGDDLPETDAVGELLALEDVTVIAIAHEKQKWLSRLNVDNGHSFDRNHIALERYRVPELADILERRARQGFHTGEVVTSEQLRWLADAVAGVARDGIQRLWGAAHVAREQGHLRIHDEDIEAGKERAEHRIRKLNLQSLPFHHQVLYAIIHEAGEISGEALHDRYDTIAEEVYHGVAPTSIGKRARRGKFKKLEEYNLIGYEGPTRDRTYRVIDGDVEPQLELPVAATQS
ncbi:MULTISPECIES: Cdc6/Cdc18 family protein [unclassified Natrinema]|uniref:Cdc6/Cdc18 family protein n=1 Tax=unclassified Natrinema TaxID=2622230 RepID=UPI0006781A69|nr:MULTISPECIES: AAA family ATPase [unclassified Natrinema]